MTAAEQIVGRERSQRVSYRQLVRCVVASRRVNSNVIPLRFLKTNNQREACCQGAPARLIRNPGDWQSTRAALSRSLVTENRLRVTIQGRDNKSLDASGIRSFLIDNLHLAALFPAASTQPFDAY
jgi:hypothetical protein